MSNGESKIAESKAALCCGFAIALRALFLGIVCFVVGGFLDFIVIARGFSLVAINRIEHSKTFDCCAF